MKSFVNLFKAVPITKIGKKNPSKELVSKTIQYGFIFSPEVVFNYLDEELKVLIDIVKKSIGLDANVMNNTFHKSWKIIRDADMEYLICQQIIHYITTYGFEAAGIYDNNLVYIPTERLKIPKIKIKEIPLVVIKGYTKEELKEKVQVVLNSGIALSEDTINDMVEVITYVGINEEELSEIKNKEIRVILYDYLGQIPKNPTEFLRFAIYKATEKTLLIKDKKTIEEIKSKRNIRISKLFKQYSDKYGLENLASIYYRFKPLFLAFRTNSEMRKITNKIRRLAVTHHKPMPEDFLNNVTNNIKKKSLDITKLKRELKNTNIFRKVRLAYALKFRLYSPDNIMYRIRNGKSFITDFDKQPAELYMQPLNIILKSISDDLKEKVSGKKIYIPEGITYTLPATEKQFIGNFPVGTSVTIPQSMVFGINWFNVDDTRIDLDLSLIDLNGNKVGWDGAYRDDGKRIMFSGDLTTAPKPHGASELFHVSSYRNNLAILFVNYFNYRENVDVPYKIIVGKGVSNFSKRYMINPNDIVASDSSKIDVKQKILGLLVTTPKICKFYYIESNLTGAISSSETELTRKVRQYLFDFYFGTITLNDVLTEAGVEFVNSKEECEIDLSPESLVKDTIIKLIS